MSICISSGHSTKCQGAVGIINEVEEATAVVDDVAIYLREAGVHVEVFHDTVSNDAGRKPQPDRGLAQFAGPATSTSRSTSTPTDTIEGHGVEVFYVTQEELARSCLSRDQRRLGPQRPGPEVLATICSSSTTRRPPPS